MSSVVVLGPKDFLNCVFHFFISIIMLQGKKKSPTATLWIYANYHKLSKTADTLIQGENVPKQVH